MIVCRGVRQCYQSCSSEVSTYCLIREHKCVVSPNHCLVRSGGRDHCARGRFTVSYSAVWVYGLRFAEAGARRGATRRGYDCTSEQRLAQMPSNHTQTNIEEVVGTQLRLVTAAAIFKQKQYFTNIVQRML